MRSTGRTIFRFPTIPTRTTGEQAAGTTSHMGCAMARPSATRSCIANWTHTFSSNAALSVAPFYHFNEANYDSRASDYPVATTWHQTSNYVGGQADARADAGPNNFSGGLYSFYQAENDLFGLKINDQSYAASSVPNTSSTSDAALVEFYLADHLAPGPVHHAAGRDAVFHLPRRIERERNLSPHRRNGENSSTELGFARILRALFPAGASSNRLKFVPEIRQPTSRARMHLFRCLRSATKSISSAFRFPTGVGCWTWTHSKIA